MISIQGLESESVKKNSDSFRFRLLPTYIGGRIIEHLGLKVYQMIYCFNIPMLIFSFLGSRLDYLAH